MDTLVFGSGETFTLSGWSVDGSVGVYIAIEASTSGVAHTLVNATAGVFTSTYCIISDSHASAAALWTADTGCEDWGNLEGWFEDASPVVGDRVFFGPGESYDITGWSVDGAPGAAILITSNPPTAQHHLVAASGGPFTSDWCVISRSDATPVDQWEALTNCIDGGDNSAGGWFTYENTFGVVLWLEAWAVTAGVTTDSQGATVVADTAAPTAGVTTDAAATDLWFEAGFTGEVPNVFSVIVWMEAWAATTETRADTYAADVIAEAVQATGGATADSGGAEVAVDLQAPSTSVPGDVGGAGAVLEAVGAAGSAQGYVQAAGVDVCGGGVGAGVLTAAVGALIASVLARGETVVSADIIAGTDVTVGGGRIDVAAVGLPGTATIAVVVQGVDGRRTRRIVEFEIQDLIGIERGTDDIVAKITEVQNLIGIWPESSTP